MQRSSAWEIYNNPIFAEKFAQNTRNINNPDFYDRLEILSLLPNVSGLKVLDAGCGPGVYLKWLDEKGADVSGIDYSKEMILQAKNNFAKPIRLFNADLNQPLNYLQDNEFDLVICTMVLIHIQDWEPLFKEFNRVLKKDGLLIFSTVHPFADLNEDSSYFEVEEITEPWNDYGVIMPSYRRSLGNIFKNIKNTGFIIDILSEPKNERTKDYAYPWFICLKLKKHQSSTRP